MGENRRKIVCYFTTCFITCNSRNCLNIDFFIKIKSGKLSLQFDHRQGWWFQKVYSYAYKERTSFDRINKRLTNAIYQKEDNQKIINKNSLVHTNWGCK